MAPKSDSKLKLECFRIGPIQMKLVPSSPSREWMDQFSDRHAYRCLPLTIANTHGWDILCPFNIKIHWNGGMTVEDITLEADDPEHQKIMGHVLRSNFARGIITFHTGFLFRTSLNWNLFVSGPFNRFKKDMVALTGIIETDWLPYPFTMNWQLMTPGTHVFEKDEPFCTVMPIPKDYLQDVVPEIYSVDDDKVLHYEQAMFARTRDEFMKKMREGDEKSRKEGWQRHYFVGRMPDHTKVEGHTNKVRLNTPEDKTGKKPSLALKKPRGEFKDMPWESYGRGAGGCPFGDDKIKMPEICPEDLPPKIKPAEAIDLQQLIRAPQTQANLEGRARLKDGILTPGPNTRYLKSGDYDGLDFIVIEDFISQDDCNYLKKAFTSNNTLLDNNIQIDYWKGRVIFAHDLIGHDTEAFKRMEKIAMRMQKTISGFYKLKEPIYPDTVQLVRWPEGSFMPPHADNSNPDDVPHGMSWRDFGSIIYLNDDYEGGEFYLTAKDMVLKPKAGMLIVVAAGMAHEHSILKIHKGDRFTLPAFYTFDKSHADKYIPART